MRGIEVPVSRVGYLLFALSIACSLSAQDRATLHTDETILRFEAGDDSPRMLSLEAPGASRWENEVDERLIPYAIAEGRSVALHWKLQRGAEEVDSYHVAFVYETVSPHLRLTWKWMARAEMGPVEHTIRIENLSSDEVWVPLQASFPFRFSISAGASLAHTYVDKGAGKPTSIGTHQVTISPSYRWEGKSSTYASDDGPREVIPWSMVQRTNGVGGRAEDGWYVGVEFSGRVNLTLERGERTVSGAVGLDPDPGPFRTRLLPGGSFDTPPIFLGAFRGDPDAAGNILRPWVRKVLGNPVTWADPKYPMLVNNSWGGGMQVDEDLARRMIRDSAELGVEMFHLDAGWFRGVGDWYPDPKKFPRGLAALSDAAHQQGLRFGLWVNWAEAGVEKHPGALNVEAAPGRDWLVADVPAGWLPEPFVGRTIDLGAPAAKVYAEGELKRIVSSYKLDMLEHDGYVVAHACARADHPHAAPPPSYASVVAGSGAALPLSANSTDVSYQATRAYYSLYAEIRAQHPGLLFEICNDGGRMVDFGSASHGDYFSITDSYDPLSNRQAFYDASHLLPPAMLEDYVEKWPTPTLANFRFMLRSGMMGWLTIMQDTNAWTAEQHAAAKEEFALYKSRLRPYIREADLYHISERPDGVRWDGIEYFAAQQGAGVVYAFRGSTLNEGTHRFVLRGVLPGRRYRLHFQDRSSADETVLGEDLLSLGLEVHLAEPNSSELIFFEVTEDPRPFNGPSQSPIPR